MIKYDQPTHSDYARASQQTQQIQIKIGGVHQASTLYRLDSSSIVEFPLWKPRSPTFSSSSKHPRGRWRGACRNLMSIRLRIQLLINHWLHVMWKVMASCGEFAGNFLTWLKDVQGCSKMFSKMFNAKHVKVMLHSQSQAAQAAQAPRASRPAKCKRPRLLPRLLHMLHLLSSFNVTAKIEK